MSVRGRIPGHYRRIQLKVTDATENKIVVEDTNKETSKSGFQLIIWLDKQLDGDKVIHLLLPDEREVLCTMQWMDKQTQKLKCFNGEAAIRRGNSIRCDSLECLEFWMELDEERS